MSSFIPSEKTYEVNKPEFSEQKTAIESEYTIEDSFKNFDVAVAEEYNPFDEFTPFEIDDNMFGGKQTEIHEYDPDSIYGGDSLGLINQVNEEKGMELEDIGDKGLAKQNFEERFKMSIQKMKETPDKASFEIFLKVNYIDNIFIIR